VLALVVAVSCSNPKDTEPFEPSQRGAVAPDGGGPLLGEAAACQRLKDAESSARQALGCDALARTCPESIRPAGGEACFEYDQASIEGCATLFASFTSCQEFSQHPCVIRAVSMCDVGSQGTAGSAGAGGALAFGAAGSAGASYLPGEAGGSAAGGDTAAGAGGR
jgi:hypothetical protein